MADKPKLPTMYWKETKRLKFTAVDKSRTQVDVYYPKTQRIERGIQF